MGALLFKNRRYQKAAYHLTEALKRSGLEAEQQDKAKRMLAMIKAGSEKSLTGELSDESSPQISPEEQDLTIPPVKFPPTATWKINLNWRFWI